jgi:hypothetical protein
MSPILYWAHFFIINYKKIDNRIHKNLYDKIRQKPTQNPQYAK